MRWLWMHVVDWLKAVRCGRYGQETPCCERLSYWKHPKCHNFSPGWQFYKGSTKKLYLFVIYAPKSIATRAGKRSYNSWTSCLTFDVTYATYTLALTPKSYVQLARNVYVCVFGKFCEEFLILLHKPFYISFNFHNKTRLKMLPIDFA